MPLEKATLTAFNHPFLAASVIARWQKPPDFTGWSLIPVRAVNACRAGS
jgi:hypothetical protein